MTIASKTTLGALLITSGLLLGACTGETDPSKAGFFDNINNLNTGEYDRQIAAGEATAAGIARDNQRRQASVNSLNAQKSANSATANRLRGQISAARSDLSAARAKAGGDPAKLARLRQLEGQISSVQKASASGGSDAVLRRELSSIRSSIRAVSS